MWRWNDDRAFSSSTLTRTYPKRIWQYAGMAANISSTGDVALIFMNRAEKNGKKCILCTISRVCKVFQTWRLKSAFFCIMSRTWSWASILFSPSIPAYVCMGCVAQHLVIFPYSNNNSNHIENTTIMAYNGEPESIEIVGATSTSFSSWLVDGELRSE